MRLVAALLACFWPAGVMAADADAVRMLNQFRAQAGLNEVRWSDQLEQAALAHADDMIRRGFFSHTGSDGSDVGKRVNRTGYRWCYIAENIAMGQRTLQEVMQGWIASRGHRRNMLLRDVREFAVVEGPGRAWVMVLAQPC